MPRTELGNEELQFEPTQRPTPFHSVLRIRCATSVVLDRSGDRFK